MIDIEDGWMERESTSYSLIAERCCFAGNKIK